MTNLFSKNGVPVARSASFRTFSGRRISGSIRMRWGLVPSSSEQLRGAGNCRQGPTTVSNQPWDPPNHPTKKFCAAFPKAGPHPPVPLVATGTETSTDPPSSSPQRGSRALFMSQQGCTDGNARAWRSQPRGAAVVHPPNAQRKSFAQLFQKRGHTPQSLRSQPEPGPPPTPRHPRRSGDPEHFLCLNKAVLTETRRGGGPNPGVLRSSIPLHPTTKFCAAFPKAGPHPPVPPVATGTRTSTNPPSSSPQRGSRALFMSQQGCTDGNAPRWKHQPRGAAVVHPHNAQKKFSPAFPETGPPNP